MDTSMDVSSSGVLFSSSRIVQPTNSNEAVPLKAPPLTLVEYLLDHGLNERADNGYGEDEEFGDGDVLESSNAYAWEAGYDRTWDSLRETDGRLDLLGALLPEKRKKKERSEVQLRKGTIRNIMFLIDMSETSRETDFKPDRLNCIIMLLEEFFETFFQFNPLANVGVISLVHSQAIVVNPPSGNPEDQVQKLVELRSRDISGGSISLLNGIERGLALLSSTPPYGSRELIIIFNSIKTCDSGNIDDVINELKERGVKTSIISTSPELYVLKKICKETEGTYSVCRTPNELKEAVISIRAAPNWNPRIETRLIQMGFPDQIFSTTVSLCICHNRPSLKGYICPRCHCKSCELPTKCRSCHLHLASAADIARTFQHLTPPPPSVKVPLGQYCCCLCFRQFTSGGMTCNECYQIFCHACDIIRADVLQQCPTCLQRKNLLQRTKQVLP